MIDPVALSGKITYSSDASTDELADLWETPLRPLVLEVLKDVDWRIINICKRGYQQGEAKQTFLVCMPQDIQFSHNACTV
jgi:hypothetical protein